MKAFEPNQVITRDDMVYPEGALVVHGYSEDGSLLAFQKGGGVQFVIPAEETHRFSVVSKMEKTPIYRKSRFYLEALDDKTFEGWTSGESWNGWEMPYFELKTAQSVLDALGATWTFLDDKNALKANLDVGNGCEEVEWEAELLEMPDGGALRLIQLVLVA